MSTLQKVEALTKAFADERADLAARLRGLNDEVEKAKRSRLPGIRRAVEAAAKCHAALDGLLKENPGLFERPRTQTFHGVKVGYRKMKGEITWEADDVVVKLIRRHCPESFDALVKTVETPLKDALAQLPASELKKLGVSVENDADVVVIKPTDSEIDRAVNALLKDAIEEEIGA